MRYSLAMTVNKDRQIEKPKAYETIDLNLWYNETQALKNVNLAIYEQKVTAIIGPSGCGKSTLLKTFNRMVELVPSVRISGEVQYRGRSIFDKNFQVEQLRTNVGMVFQKPTPFPKSIYANVAYGLNV